MLQKVMDTTRSMALKTGWAIKDVMNNMSTEVYAIYMYSEK